MPITTWLANLAQQSCEQLGVLDRGRTQYHAVDPAGKGRLDIGHRPQAPAQLQFDRQFGDIGDCPGIDWMPGAGPVQIDDMQPTGALFKPSSGRLYRVRVENVGAGKITLVQANRPPGVDVNCRIDRQHGQTTFSRWPGRGRRNFDKSQVPMAAFFRVKLGGKDQSLAQHAQEIYSVFGHPGAVTGIGRIGVVGVHEIKIGPAGYPFKYRAGGDLMDLVPAHVRDMWPRREPSNGAAVQAQALGVVIFFRPRQQDMQSHADP